MEILENVIRKTLSEGTPFLVKEIHLMQQSSRPFKMDGGAVCLCTGGSAELIINTKKYRISKGYGAILLDDSTLFIKGCSTDFCMKIFLYSKEIAFQATHKFDPAFFGHLVNHPVYRHREESDDNIMSYMNILSNLQNDILNRFGSVIATNLLRCIMLNAYDKMLRHGQTKTAVSHTRKEELFNKFMMLLNEHGRRHRDVAYYAGRLCISPRYLGEITKSVAGKSPKTVIDHHIVSEIKLMLTFSDMTLYQIADYLHFPDQSYFGRFFRHYTGMSPLSYRKQEITL